MTKTEIAKRISHTLEKNNFPHKEPDKPQRAIIDISKIKYCPKLIPLTRETLKKLEQAKTLKANPKRKTPKKTERLKTANYLSIMIERLEALQRKDRITYIENKGASATIQGLETNARRMTLPPQIYSDRNKIYEKLIQGNFISKKLKPISKNEILQASLYDIVRYYNSISYGILSYYRCCEDLHKIKNIVQYMIKFSLIRTIKNKLKFTSTKKVFDTFGREIQVEQGGKKVKFIHQEITAMKREFLTKPITSPFEHINKVFISMQNSDIYKKECSIMNCEESEGIEIHHIRKLYRSTQTDKKSGKTIAVIDGKSKKLTGTAAFESALKRKQIPLCRKHHIE